MVLVPLLRNLDACGGQFCRNFIYLLQIFILYYQTSALIDMTKVTVVIGLTEWGE